MSGELVVRLLKTREGFWSAKLYEEGGPEAFTYLKGSRGYTPDEALRHLYLNQDVKVVIDRSAP